ncbi:MAG: hypothetical protein EBT79_10730 [Actinobacteria bacterium]|nr:hypothetical protein [Actinomycetota bacterium]
MTMRRFALDAQGMSEEGLSRIADVLSSLVDSMDDESVAFGAYVATAVPGERQHILGTLPARLLLSYRRRLVGWFEFALRKRARAGGGGSVIKKINDGLEAFVHAIPGALASGQTLNVSDFVPVNEYLVPERLNQVGQSILRVVRAEAQRDGAIGDTDTRMESENPPIGFHLMRDEKAGVWYIPSSPRTFRIKDRLRDMGFKWNAGEKTWDVRSLTPEIRREFGMTEVAPSATLARWFATWLPVNIDRFTRIFTDHARSKNSSYAIKFKMVEGRADVSFVRDVDSIAKAVEELRYRYTNKHGREPWLETIDRFIDLVDAKTPNQVQRLIDRINNLQHSNGLFMEHFPSEVQAWYEGFLNAKYHTPTADELAKQIPDRDLRGLLVEVARSSRRPADWAYTPTPNYRSMKKELADVGDQVNWRKEGYPAYKGVKQIDRFSPDVQSRLDVLMALDTQRERILSTEVTTPQQEESVVEQARDWSVDHERAIDGLRDALEAQRRMELEDPNHAAAWDAINFPKEFIARFPYAVPGASKSELAQFVARYAALGLIAVR